MEPEKRHRTIFVITLVIVSFLLTIIGIGLSINPWVYGNGDTSTSSVHASTVYNGSEDYFAITSQITNIDLDSATFTISFAFTASGIYLQSSNLDLPIPVIFTYGTSVINLTSFTQLGSQQLSLGFSSGTDADYPFDVYGLQNPIAMYNKNFSSVPIYFISQPSQVPLYVANTFNVTQDGIINTIQVTRITIVKTLSVLMMMFLWILSLSFAYMASVCVWHNAKPDLTIGTGATLLFSMGNLRSAQPGIPSTVVGGDIFGYFWNLAIVAVFTVALIIWWGINCTPEKPGDVRVVDAPWNGVEKGDKIE